MSDLIICEKCRQPAYACQCIVNRCAKCGRALDEEETETENGLCFGCYVERSN